MRRSDFLWGAAVGLAILCTQASQALGRAFHVRQDDLGDALSVQVGIDLASDGDTVWVYPGRYVENVRFNGRSICLMSTAGPEATILDGSGREESVVRMIDGEGPATLLRGFTITGGRAVLGGGIHLLGSEPRIRENLIQDNFAESGGGGLYCVGSSIDGRWSPLIEENQFVSNEAGTLGGAIQVHGNATPIIVRNAILENEVVRGDGGGIAIFARLDGIVIRENWIEGNSAGDHAGGIVVIGRGGSPDYPMDIEVAQNVIVRNVAYGVEATGESGGGIELAGTDAWIHHNTIVGNTGYGYSGNWGGGIVVFSDSSPLIEMNIIAYSTMGGGILCRIANNPTIRNNLGWENVGGEGWGDCANWWQGDGNLIADPLLCDWESGVYTVAENSPALTHPAGPLGAFESTGCAQVSVVPMTWGWIKQHFKK